MVYTDNAGADVNLVITSSYLHLSVIETQEVSYHLVTRLKSVAKYDMFYVCRT
jgi:hypothetical protein